MVEQLEIKDLILGQIVIVVSTDNYKNGEPSPFKGEVVKLYDHEVDIKSLVTGREYELYGFQILELLYDKEIRNMIDLGKYGDFCNG